MTQSAVMSQNDAPNCLMSETTILSPADPSLNFTCSAALRSRKTYTRFATIESAHSPAATHRAARQPVITSALTHRLAFSAIQASVLKLNRVPSRMKVSASPKAKASSLPLNHLARMALWQTISDSAPMPKTVRPAIISQKVGATATITAPITISTEKTRLMVRVPKRSIRKPPMRTITTLGQL